MSLIGLRSSCCGNATGSELDLDGFSLPSPLDFQFPSGMKRAKPLWISRKIWTIENFCRAGRSVLGLRFEGLNRYRGELTGNWLPRLMTLGPNWGCRL